MCVGSRNFTTKCYGLQASQGHHQARSHHQACSGSKDYQTTYSNKFFQSKVTIYHHGINIKKSLHHVFLEACHHQQGIL